MHKSKKDLRHFPLIPVLLTLLTIVFVQTAVLAKSGEKGRPDSFAELIKKAGPSVVNINAVKVIRTPGQGPSPFGMEDPLRDFFERFFGGQMPQEFRQNALGTGFIIDRDGLILTNNHVVEQTEQLRVRLSDDREFKAQIIGRDPKTDLALIKIKTDKPLAPLSLGDSDRVEVGDWVVAIGNPFGLGNTVTAGIVSAKYRQLGGGPYDNFIQTDASINPGNSGGPLLNLDGEVVGVNSAIFSESGGNIGIGFAIPINMAKQLLPQLRQGKVSRSWIGVMIQNITPELKDKLELGTDEGALVSGVMSGGPAEKAGIKRGDVILRFNAKAIRSSRDLPFVVASTPIGKTVVVEVMRDNQQMSLQIRTEELKEEAEAVPSEDAGPYLDLGMEVQEITPEMAKNYGLERTSGVIIVQVESGSAAAEAGLSPGDIIVEIDRKQIKGLNDLNRLLAGVKAGDTVLFLIDRGGMTIFVTLNVEK
ncbi:MAG: DegQ family serine endoprotease [Deltaproteobacteria bacterium]|nr:DegQ family serine endoprotease [Deltaproteobacteria bacterium]